jgi:hypothetical protein
MPSLLGQQGTYAGRPLVSPFDSPGTSLEAATRGRRILMRLRQARHPRKAA